MRAFPKSTPVPTTILALVLLGGCASYEDMQKTNSARLEPAPDGYRYVVRADPTYPESSEEAERDRMRWLGEDMRANGACPGGWEIASRRTMLVQKALLGDAVDIFYDVRCLGGAAEAPERAAM